MKFNDLVFLAEMDYSQVPGEHSQAVRDATLGDEPGEGQAQYKFIATKHGNYIEPYPDGEWIVDSQLVKYMGKPYMVFMNFDENEITHEVDRDPASGEKYITHYYGGNTNDVQFKGFEVHSDNTATKVTDPKLIENLKDKAFNNYFNYSFNPRDYADRHSSN